MKKNDVILGILCIILGISANLFSNSFPMDAADFPKAMSIVLIFLGGVLLVRNYRFKKENQGETKTETKADINNKIYLRVGSIALLFIIYYLVLEKLGYIIPTFLISFLTIYILKYKSLKTNLILSSVLSISLYLIFTFAFQVNLPKGIFY